MKKDVRQVQQHTGVMETGDHFKNGASLKGQTNKGNRLRGMKRMFVLLAIAFACGTAKSSAQFADMGALYQWLNMQNMQSQQMMNQLMNTYIEGLGNIEHGRVKDLRVNESKSYTVKDKKGAYGKYGAVIYFTGGNVGINNSLNSIKVTARRSDGNSIDITDKCAYFVDRILVPPLFTTEDVAHDDVHISIDSYSSSKVKHGTVLIESIVWMEDDVVGNHSKYLREVQNYYEVMTKVLQDQGYGGTSMPSTGSYGSSSSGSSSTYEETCSSCKGKGWIPGSKTPTFGIMGTKWCSECGQEVTNSHSHDQCPSCRGTGKVTRIR
jgi:hypothetical protein